MKTLTKKDIGITLREYQATDVQSIEEALTQYLSVLYQLPTGGGKGVVMTKLISDYTDKHITVFAHKKKLLRQIHKNLAKIGITAGLIMGAVNENLDSKVLLVSIRSAVKSKRLEDLVKRPTDIVMIDEARHSRTGSYDLVLDRLRAVHPKHKLLGFDATPFRKDKKPLDKHFQSMLISCENIKSLQDKGFLAKEKVYATKIGDIKGKVKEVANDYQMAALSNYMRQPIFLNYVVDSYIAQGENRQAIVFAVDKAHSKDLLKVFKEKLPNVTVKQIDSDLDEADIETAYAEYESGELQILINVEMITEGVDLPETGCIVGARPTKSISLYLQMAGRGTRPKKDGSELIIIDCAGWTEEFGSISAPRNWSLDPEVDPNDARKKNRIVGKRKDGTLTTEVDEMADLTELVEMTPEEYIGKVEGGLKAAEKQNQTIDEKISEVKAEMEELLHKAALQSLRSKTSPFTCIIRVDEYDSDKLTAYYFHTSRHQKKKARRSDEEIDAWVDNTHVIEMVIGTNRKLMFAKLDTTTIDKGDNYYGRKDTEQSLKEYREMTDVCSSINHQVQDDKSLTMQIIEKRKIIHDLEKSKIDVHELKDLQKKFESDKYKQSVDQHVKEGKVFIFNAANIRWADSYFKHGRGQIYAIRIKDNDKITEYHNDIEYARDLKLSLWEEKNYIKGDRVREIIKEGKWEVQNE